MFFNSRISNQEGWGAMFKSKASQIWAENILKYREIHMISQNELARKVRRSTMAICRYESGTIPSPSVIDRIAKAFNIKVHELFIPVDEKPWPARKVAL